MKMDIILGLIRHALTIVGGYYVARGKLDQGSADTIIGAASALIGVGWSIANKTSSSDTPPQSIKKPLDPPTLP